MPLYASGGFEDGSRNDAPPPPSATTYVPAPPRATTYGGGPSQPAGESLQSQGLKIWPLNPSSPVAFTPQGYPVGFPVCYPGERFGPDGAVYMLPGETPDMFDCDVCGKPGHRASVCAYKSKFPPDGQIARPDLYEVICWCGSLNISPDPPRKCNRCRNGGDALMVRSKHPPHHHRPSYSCVATPHELKLVEALIREWKTPQTEDRSGRDQFGSNVMF